MKIKILVKTILSLTLPLLYSCSHPDNQSPLVNIDDFPDERTTLEHLKESIKKYPESLDAYIMLAQEAYQAKQYDVAYDAALKAYKLNKNLPVVRYNLMKCFVEKGLYLDAESMMLTLHSHEWPHEEWVAVRSKILAHTGNYQKALDYLELRIKQQGESVPILLEKSAIYASLQDTNRSMDALRKAYALDSTYELVWGKLASMYLTLNKPDSALRMATQIYQTDTTRTDYLQLLVRSYLHHGLYKPALAYAQKLYQLDSVWYDSKELLAHAYYRNQYFKEAIPLYEVCARMKPAKKELQLRLGVCYHETGQLDEALFWYEKIDSTAANYKFAQQMAAQIRRQKTKTYQQ